MGRLQRPLRRQAISLGFEARNGSATLQVRAVYNLYSITTNQAAIASLSRILNRYVGNLPPMPGVFPDYPAPVVRNAGAERELTMMRVREVEGRIQEDLRKYSAKQPGLEIEWIPLQGPDEGVIGRELEGGPDDPEASWGRAGHATRYHLLKVCSK
jgi:hypothetical protein